MPGRPSGPSDSVSSQEATEGDRRRADGRGSATTATDRADYCRAVRALAPRSPHPRADGFGHPVLPAIPESRAVLTYSLRGRLWRPVAKVVLADLERRRAVHAGTPASGGA